MASTRMPPAPRSRRLAPQVGERALAWLTGLLIGIGGAWGAGPASGANGTSADIKLGQRLLAQYQCGSCHAIPGVAAARGVQGPSLEAFGRRSYIAGRIPNQPDSLARWIVAPTALVPDTAMPAMGVSPADARHMAAYLGSLK
ncbi:MAG: c-type cytochrome [Polaromonas sp.]